MNEHFDKFGYINALDGADLTRGEFRVLIAVWRYSDRNGQRAYASAARLSRDCRMTERTARGCLVELRRKGFLRRVRRGGRDAGPRASEYELSLPACFQPAAGGQLETSQPATDCQLDGEPTGKNLQPNRQKSVSQPATDNTPTEPEQSREQSRGGARESEPPNRPAVPDFANAPPPPNNSYEQPRCERHRDPVRYPNPPNCRDCRDIRLQHEAQEQAATEQQTATKTAIDHAVRWAIDHCPDCDPYGRLDNQTACPNHPSFRNPWPPEAAWAWYLNTLNDAESGPS